MEKSRAYRRHTHRVKFFKRVNDWISRTPAKDKLLEKEEILHGEMATFLHSTGKPCSCSSCSEHYDRKEQKKINEKAITEGLVEDENEN
jgi:hypothetical protein